MGLIPDSSPSGSDGTTSVDVDSDEEKPPAASNTRVKIIPVSAIPPATQSPVPIQSRTGTTRLSSPQITTYYESDADARRTSQVHPSGTTRRSSSQHRRSFLHRRMDVWDTERDISAAGSSRKLGAGSISALPVAVQASFRRKVLMIFDLQLLLLTGIMCLLTYNPALSSLLHRVFYSEYILLIALGAMVAALFVLYRIHSLFPWNWIAMVVFTAVFSVLIAGVQVVLKTHAGVFCCAFTFLAMSVMTLLCGVKRSNGTDAVFLSALVAGFVSYAVVAVGSAIVFGALEWHFVSLPMFAYSLVLEFALIMWFSYDAITIFRLITPDEYMHGVIYFYTDVLVLTMISVAAIALVLLCTACGGAGGGGAGFGYINPTGCSSGCCGCCGDGAMEGDEGEAEDEVTEIGDTAAAENQTIERG